MITTNQQSHKMAAAGQYYTCNRCPFRTTLPSRIGDHLFQHTGTTKPSPFTCFDTAKPIKCTTCDFTTPSLVLLRYHLVRHHDQQQYALKAKLKNCKKCTFRTNSNYLWLRHRTFGTCNVKKEPKVKTRRVRVPPKKERKWFACGKCDYRTVNSGNLRKHVVYRHTPLDEIDWQECTKCPAKFKLVSDLRQHRKGHEGGVDVLNCAECDYTTPTRQDLYKHYNRRHAKPEEIKWVECHDCGGKFKDKEILRMHLRTHRAKDKKYECTKCSFKTDVKAILKSHIINRHLKDDEIKWYKCQHCDYKAKQNFVIVKHTQYMHSEKLELLQCPHCSFKTKRPSNLRGHIARFHDNSAFKCDLCDYRAKYEKCIETHKKNKHGVGDITWLKCEHCDFSTKYKHNLKNHILAKHNKDGMTFQCKQCQYKTSSKDYFTQHVAKIHKRPKVEATIVCAKCSFVTATKKQLQHHMFNKHTVHDENKKLKCAHCTYTSYIKRNLVAHLKHKHTIGENIRWYQCDKCDYKNKQKNCLVSHMYTAHNEGKLLKCDQCIYKVRCPRAMQKHKKKHETKKWIPKTVSEKFECYICGYKTNQKINIYKHITRTHLKKNI